MKLKNVTRLLLFVFVIACIAPSCTKQGPIGLTGNDGTNGSNGKDANSACITCHTTSIMDGMEAQYKLSKHFFGTTVARNGKYCARCHTSDGFEEITANGKFVVTNDIPNATRITCATCHKHSAFDFTGDTATYILRTTSPVALEYYNNAKTQDFGTIDNLCSTCHQIRGITTPTVYKNSADSIARKADATFKQLPFFPLDNANEATTVKFQIGQGFSVHDGNQSNLFAGINGYEYAGKTYTKVWKHSAYSCVDCHMNEYDATTKTGGHTLIPNEAKCTACHAGDKLTAIQVAVSAKIIELGEELSKKKVFKKTVNATSGAVSYSAEPSHDYFGVLFPTTKTATVFGISLTNYNTVSPTTGLVIYASTVKSGTDSDYANRIGREWKYGELGAAYNYGYINSELSKGIHNPKYAIDILQNSIDYLKSY